MSLKTQVEESTNDKIDRKNKYFTRANNQETILTFSNHYSPPKHHKAVASPTTKTARFSLANPIYVKSKNDGLQVNLTHSLSKQRQQVIPWLGTPNKQQNSFKEKQQGLRSTDGTQGSIMNQFRAVLNYSDQKQLLSEETNQNKNNGIIKHERSKSSEKIQKAVYPLRSKISLNAKNQRDSKKLERLSQYSQIEDFPEQMQQTILQFKEVLDHSFTPKIKKMNEREEIEELNEEINNLRLMIKQRDKAWQLKMNDTLKKEKTLVVQSFKKMLNQLKKMCQWQKFGSTSMDCQPVIISSKKLFSSYPIQHQFKNSMQEIRNTLMQLKILNSESQTLREELQNLRSALQQQRQIKENLEEEVQSLKRINKQISKEQQRWKQKQQQYRGKINSLTSEVQTLKVITQSPVIQSLTSFGQTKGLSLQKQCSRSTFVQSKQARFERKIKQLILQNNILKDLVEDLRSKISCNKQKHVEEVMAVKQAHKKQIQKLSNSFHAKLWMAQQRKLQIHNEQNKVPICFRMARKSSLQHEKPYEVVFRQQVEGLYS